MSSSTQLCEKKSALCTFHSPFPTQILTNNNAGAGSSHQQKPAQNNPCFKNMVNMILHTVDGSKCTRAVCLPFTGYAIQCALQNPQCFSDQKDSSKVQIFIMKMDNKKTDSVVQQCISYSARDLHIHPRILQNLANITIVPSDLCKQANPDESSSASKKRKLMSEQPLSDSTLDTALDATSNAAAVSSCSASISISTTESRCTGDSEVLAYAKPLSCTAFQREYPCFTNMCGYMLLKYVPNPVYTESGYMVLHSPDTRLGKGDMVNGECGKFCVENDVLKMSYKEVQKVTFSAVRDMRQAKMLISQLVMPVVDSSTSSTSKKSLYKPMVVVHMVVASCRVQHYIAFGAVSSQLSRSIVCFNLQHIFSFERRLEMDTSMMFLKVKDWNALLLWMESPEVLGESMHAYREACRKAKESQLPYIEAWLETHDFSSVDSKENKNDKKKESCPFERDIDENAHMMARITMNGFLQIHLMWNKEDRLAKRVPKSVRKGRKGAGAKQVEAAVVPKIGGIFWTDEVEVMVKMRMGIIMYAIEILS